MTKKLLLALLAALLFYGGMNAWRLSPGLRVDALNVGQGDAILITTPEQKHMLIDGGPDSLVLSELGAVLPPALRRLDTVVLTHPHLDHLAGLVPVLQRFEVETLVLSGANYEGDAYRFFLDQVSDFEGRVVFANEDSDFSLGSAHVDVLYPFRTVVGQEFEELNNSSIVMKVTWGEVDVLLMGDAEKEVEVELLARGVDLEADVLKAGHHGSESSSTKDFLEEVGAAWMLILCGAGNSYGHPHDVTLQKAAALDMKVLRTDLEGRVSLVFTENCAQSWRLGNGVFHLDAHSLDRCN